MSKLVHEWSPEWAPHVSGRYEQRVIGPSGMPEEQRIIATCSTCKTRCRCDADGVCACGAEWRGGCSTGAVRTHIARFAALHLHRDPFVQGPPHLAGNQG